jgi:hypothetical protein
MLTLPIEGDITAHSSLRSETNFKRVIEILDLLRSGKIKKKYIPKIWINTVAIPSNAVLPSNVDKLYYVAGIVDKYNVDVWKIFEYIHYKNINRCLELSYDNIKPVINDLESTIKNCKTDVVYDSCENRTGRYFMINPNGVVVVPKLDKGNVFYNKEIGSFIYDFDVTLDNWKKEGVSKKHHLFGFLNKKCCLLKFFKRCLLKFLNKIKNRGENGKKQQKINPY